MDIGRILKDSWAIFVKDWGALIVAALIMVVLGGITLGILAVPLSAGLYLMILRRVREGRKAEVGDVFACFDRRRLLRRLPAVPGHLPLLRRGGGAAAGAARDPQHGRPRVRRLSVRPRPDRGDRCGRYLETVWVYWTDLMVDRRLAVIEALKESRAIVARSGFWRTFLVILVVG